MKYIPVQETIPQSKRQEFNEKIVYLIDSDTAVGAGITKEDIYNAYTGDGGLHGLERSMFDSYAKYSEAKKRWRTDSSSPRLISANLSQTVCRWTKRMWWQI